MTVHTFIVILSWFVDSLKIESTLITCGLIEEHQVECYAEKVSNAVLDENVDAHLLHQCLTDNAWKLTENVVKWKKDCDVWLRKILHHYLHDSKSKQSIICDSCLEWYDFSCARVITLPKMTNWFYKFFFYLLLKMLTSYVCRLSVHYLSLNH